MIKVDLRKAFDSIDWSFLNSMLEGLNFPPMFIHWIMECVSTTSYLIALNRSLFRHFKGKRGLRQGDPFSPFLFVICLEYLSRLLKINTTESNFNFHPNCTQLGITYLAFADDLMLMSRGDATSVKILIEFM